MIVSIGVATWERSTKRFEIYTLNGIPYYVPKAAFPEDMPPSIEIMIRPAKEEEK